MRKSILFVAITLFLIIKCFSQPNLIPHGTLLIAYICDDGILLAADSRASWNKGLDSNNNFIWYAHMDSVRKVYPLGFFQIMTTGITVYKSDLIENIIIEYNRKLKPDLSITQTFQNFKNYTKKKYKLTDSIFNEVTYIMAGYEKSVPTILYSDSLGSVVSHTRLLRVVSDTSALKYLNPVYPFNTDYQIEMIENIFNESSRRHIFIGGPINMIKINPDNTVTNIKTFKFSKPSFKTEIEFFKAILDGKLDIKYHYSWSKSWLTFGLKCAVKCPCLLMRE